MSKKLFFSVALGAILLTSCSSEEPAVNSADGNVTFNVTLPAGLLTRAESYNTIYDNGTQATELTYAVYDASGANIPTLNGTATLSALKADVNLNLVSGKTYTIVFWAQAPDAPYNFDSATGKMTVTTTGAAQDLKRDAFFYSETFTVTGAINKEIILNRPFAQINIGACDFDDFSAAGGTLTTSGMTVTAPSVLNLLDGTVDVEQEYVLTPAALACGSSTPEIAFPCTTDPAQKYLTTAFILANGKSTVEVKWTSDNAARPEVTYAHIPVQRNYRTNIYGHLLTQPAKYSVMIDPVFEEGDFNKTPIDGFVNVEEANDLVTILNERKNAVLDENITVDIEDISVYDSEIDLNGKTLTINGNSDTVRDVIKVGGNSEAGKLVIKNGTLVLDKGVEIAADNSSLTIKDVTLTFVGEGICFGDNVSKSTVTLENCSVVAGNSVVYNDGTAPSDRADYNSLFAINTNVKSNNPYALFMIEGCNCTIKGGTMSN